MARAWVQVVSKRVKVETNVDYTRYTLGSETPLDSWPDMNQVVLPVDEEEKPVSPVRTTKVAKFFNVVLSLSVEEAALVNQGLVLLAYDKTRADRASRVTPLQNELAKALNKAREAEKELEGEN